MKRLAAALSDWTARFDWVAARFGWAARSDADEHPIDRRLRKVRRKKDINAILLRVCVTAAAVFAIFGVVFGIARVEGSSMSPALEAGDIAVFRRVGVTYLAGDIVLVRMEDGTENVKRVVALPGQTVDIDQAAGELLVDGEVLSESYVYEGTYRKSGVDYPLVLGEGEYFVLGDNRGNSLDSRTYGPVDEGRLDGKLLFVAFRWEG